ncbi:MAG: AAA family ATPase [Flammeovirgaceae bacterium]
MKKVLILKGLPGSGKSTYAKQLVTEQANRWKRINKDDLRAMLDNGHFSKGNERFVLKMRDIMIREALLDGKSVISDDTNLHPRHETRIRQVVDAFCKETGHEVAIEVKLIDTPLEECIQRDLKRMASVGERVIREAHKKYFLKREGRGPFYAEQDETLPKAIICDLDGTLAILKRNPFDASTCEEDELNQPVYDVVKSYHEKGYRVILVSGRMDTYKPQTLTWLEKYQIPYDELIMRREKDMRKDAAIKREIFETHIKPNYFVAFVLDDRNQVVDMWRNELGLACLQVNYGDF